MTRASSWRWCSRRAPACSTRFEEDSLIEAIATELERTHGFVHIESNLRAAVRVSAEEDETAAIPVDERAAAAPTEEDNFRTMLVEVESRTARTARLTDEPSARAGGSDVEADLDDVAVLHLVVLALGAQLGHLARLGERAELDQVVVVDYLGANEAAREVGVDGGRGVDGR